MKRIMFVFLMVFITSSLMAQTMNIPVDTCAQSVWKFGENPDIDQTVEDIWDYGGSYTFMTTASTLYISSDNAGDDQTYSIQGLDADWELQTETVTASGVTFVAVDGTWLRVFRVKNTGTTDNAGNIYVSDDNTDAGGNGIPDTVSNIKAFVRIGKNQTLMAIYTVPAGGGGYWSGWFASLTNKKNAFATVNIYMRPYGGVFQIKETWDLAATGSSFVHREYDPPQLVAGKTDIIVRATTSIDDVGIAAGFDVIFR